MRCRRRLLLPTLLFALSCEKSDRYTSELGGVEYGATCESDDDCGGPPDSCCTDPVCSPEGWCSPTCSTNADCPNGFYCVDFEGSRCFAGCMSDADCPTGFVCDLSDGLFACRYENAATPEGGGGAGTD